ncbi:MAG: O-antigen ligase family protein, partial [Candidatus Omnitrophica bacterium]|nr:O-antigen ligase family protein [Candidatus Omnitrophota bacterium]
MAPSSSLSRLADRAAFWSLVACAAVAPLGMAPQEATIVLAIVAWLIKHAADRAWPRQTPATWPLLLWVLIAALSLVNAAHLPTSLKGLQKMAKVIGLFFVASETLRSRQRLLAVLTAMMLGAVIVSADGLAQVARGADLIYGHAAGMTPGGWPRLAATFGHPNDFGTYAVTILPACVMMALPSMTLRRRWWSWGVVGLLGICLLFTFSRSSALAVAVSVTAFAVLRRAWKSLVVLGAVGAVGALCLPAPIREWVASQPSWLHAIAQPLRFEIWQAGFNMIREHPYLGIGVNQFVRNYARYRIPGDTLEAAYGHNHYLQMAAEIGMIGLGAFLWLLGRTAVVWGRLLRHREAWVRSAAMGLGCGVVAFLTIGLLESALHSSRTNVFFWLWMGTLHGLGTI